MRRKSLALLILALGCGLVASLGITQVLKRGDSVPSDTVGVFVAKDDIGSGSLVNNDNTKMEQWPKDRVPAGAITRQEDLDGRRTRQKIFAGEPLIDPKLLVRGQGPIEVPKGLRVVAVSVGPEAIQGGLVLPGSRCDVQVFIRADSNQSESLCKTILQDIRVFAVDDVTSIESQDPRTPDKHSIPGGKTVSLLVSPSQALTVTLASQLGMIRLILRNNDDNEQPKTAVMTAHELLGVNGRNDRALEDPIAAEKERFRKWAEQMRKMMQETKVAGEKKPEADAPQRFVMRVRTGADVSDVLLINNAAVQGLDDGTWTATGMGPSTRAPANGDSHSPRPAAAAQPAATAQPIVPAKPPAAGRPAPT
jgi:pilus assembly protein CpaB